MAPICLYIVTGFRMDWVLFSLIFMVQILILYYIAFFGDLTTLNMLLGVISLRLWIQTPIHNRIQAEHPQGVSWCCNQAAVHQVVLL